MWKILIWDCSGILEPKRNFLHPYKIIYLMGKLQKVCLQPKKNSKFNKGTQIKKFKNNWKRTRSNLKTQVPHSVVQWMTFLSDFCELGCWLLEFLISWTDLIKCSEKFNSGSLISNNQKNFIHSKNYFIYRSFHAESPHIHVLKTAITN